MDAPHVVGLEKIEQFRSSKQPISTLWRVDGEEAYGSLSWRNGRANLSLFVSAPFVGDRGENEGSIGILRITKPPQQPTIVGRAPPYGIVTLRKLRPV